MRFKKIYLEITNKCNLNCSFCPKCERPLAFMDEETFNKALACLKPYTRYLYFHLMGEPLIHPQLENFLKRAGEEGFLVNLTTNGTLLLKNKSVLLQAPALRQINISVHSFEANEGSQTLEKYIKDITDFIKEAKATSSVICSLRLWNLDSDAYKGSNSLNQKILHLIEEGLNIGYSLEEALKEKPGFKIAEGIYINTAERFEWAALNTKISCTHKFCYGLRDHIGVLVDGTVVPCCLDNDGNIPLGNLFETPLEEILNSGRAKAIYEGFSNRVAVEELCKKCDFRAL